MSKNMSNTLINTKTKSSQKTNVKCQESGKNRKKKSQILNRKRKRQLGLLGAAGERWAPPKKQEEN